MYIIIHNDSIKSDNLRLFWFLKTKRTIKKKIYIYIYVYISASLRRLKAISSVSDDSIWHFKSLKKFTPHQHWYLIAYLRRLQAISTVSDDRLWHFKSLGKLTQNQHVNKFHIITSQQRRMSQILSEKEFQAQAEARRTENWVKWQYRPRSIQTHGLFSEQASGW